MKQEGFLKIQLAWTAVVYGILLFVVVSLFNQKFFDVSEIQVLGANAAQPQIFLN